MKKNVLVINAGSSSLKYKLYSMPEECVIFRGIIERIGDNKSSMMFLHGEKKYTYTYPIPDHRTAVNLVIEFLVSQKIINSMQDIHYVGHRVAHGGESFKDAALIDDAAMSIIESLIPLAPTHNPANLSGIEAVSSLLPHTTNVAVFDTSFHQTLPSRNYIYPLPFSWYEQYKVRRFGFHGISHKYIASNVHHFLPKGSQAEKIISCHLGNGSSICAIQNGLSVNTSMGFTPLAGLMMGSRCGDIDPSIIIYLQNVIGLSCEEIADCLNNRSGLLGVSTLSNDCRDIIAAAHQGEHQAQLALEMFIQRIAATVASYITELNGIDTLVFTAGIGENSAYVRECVCHQLACLGIKLDSRANENNETLINSPTSRVTIAVIPADEELMIARDTFQLAHTQTTHHKNRALI